MAIGRRAEVSGFFEGASAKKRIQIHRVISTASRFVGFAAAFVAGTLLSSDLALAQALARRAPAESLFDASLRSAITGVVRDHAGRPQIGALVELMNAEYGVVARTFTDDRGRYSLPRLGAGLYQVQASSSLFLPVLRPNLRLLANSKAVVNLTLSTVYQALNWLPTEPRDSRSQDDDWDWTLRLATNRPLLRFVSPGDGPVVVDQVAERSGEPSRRLLVRSGAPRFGQGGLEQQFAWRSRYEGGRALIFGADTSTESGTLGRIAAMAAYRQELAPGHSWTTVASMSERPSIHGADHGAGGDGLTTVRVRSASTTRLGDLLTVSAGTELTGASLAGAAPVLGSHPFAVVTIETGEATVEYRVSTAPSMTGADALEGAMNEDAPAFTAVNGRLAMEEGLHQELRLTSKLGRQLTAQVAAFHDSLSHPMVEGTVRGSEAAIDSKDVLYDPGTGTIAVSGEGYSHGGVMGMLRDQLSPDTWLSLRYAMGEAVALAEPEAAAAPSFTARTASSVAVAGGTRLPVTHTAVRGSYRWQPVSTLTEVAPFDGNADGDPGAYLGFSLRQPIHLQHGGEGRIEAILDVRNLLAQGYRPFLSTDGTMVYFAQSQRCFAGGLAFSF